jgi:hypothetical protein
LEGIELLTVSRWAGLREKCPALEWPLAEETDRPHSRIVTTRHAQPFLILKLSFLSSFQNVREANSLLAYPENKLNMPYNCVFSEQKIL